MSRWLCVVLLLSAFLVSLNAGAQPRTFALIVTNNRSLELGRPDLQYADDDAAKYYELFRAAAPGAQLHLLTELDRDTERLFPSLLQVARPPSRGALEAAARRIALGAAQARRAGHVVHFYFIYAGHGDIDRGRGFIELKNGRFYSDELEALLKKIPATHAHVIVDSCNSFFVINARKPGGRRFATPVDAARSLSRRLPHVGVFLSTSAEADVFEWSELQSGIFSHAVRSGLSGAADADANGSVSYAELRAFVDIAASGVKNPAYRPKVYARGPGGHDGFALLPAGSAQTAQLHVDADREVRLTVRDSDGLPWIDVFKERGAPLALNLGHERLARAVIEARAMGSGQNAVRYQFDAGTPAAHDLDTLAQLAEQQRPRGDGELFSMLFTQPFGPRAFGAYERVRREETPPVFGISRDDSERMSSLLTHVSEMERDRRLASGVTALSMGALAGGIGGWVLYRGYQLEDRDSRRAAQVGGWAMAGLGALGLAHGSVSLLVRSPGEKLHEQFVGGLAAAEEPSQVVARAERGLHDSAAAYRRMRLMLRWSGASVVALSTIMFVHNELRYPSSLLWGNRFLYGTAVLMGGLSFATSYVETPVERFARLWDADPGIQRLPRVSFAPLPGGAALMVQGVY